MPALPPITIDSLGRQSGGTLPPLDSPPPSPAAMLSAWTWREQTRRDPPGQSTDDRHAQARAFTGACYVALRTVMTAIGGASVVVSHRKSTHRKSQAASATARDETDWTPVTDHPAAVLFEEINELQTASDFLGEYVLCDGLFGTGVLYVPRNGKDEPAELWCLRPNYLTPVPLSVQYPRGAFRYYMPRPMLWSHSAGNLIIDRRETVLQRQAHPLFPWDGYSALTAGAKYVDFLNSIIDSRQMAMDSGFTPDIIVKMSGATEAQMTQFRDRLATQYSGSVRGRRVLPVDAERVEVEKLNTDPDKMSYPQGYDQGTAAVMALFGVPPSVALLTESTSYSSFYAAARQFREVTLNSKCKVIGDFWTKHLIRPFWGPDYRVEIKLPPLMDPDLRERQNGTLMSGDAITRNELRASYDMGPIVDGELTPKQYQAKIQAEQAKQQQKAQQQQQGGADPLATLMGGMGGETGGVDEPQTAPGDVSNPDVGAASSGSLPGAVAKSFKGVDVASYFDRLLNEVCP